MPRALTWATSCASSWSAPTPSADSSTLSEPESRENCAYLIFLNTGLHPYKTAGPNEPGVPESPVDIVAWSPTGNAGNSGKKQKSWAGNHTTSRLYPQSEARAMDDDQKWLEAAAAIERDILYLKSAMAGRWSQLSSGLAQDIGHLQLVQSIYQKNAAAGVAWPNPDDLYCISPIFHDQPVTTAIRRDFKIA